MNLRPASILYADGSEKGPNAVVLWKGAGKIRRLHNILA
jgi:hypothetical protein